MPQLPTPPPPAFNNFDLPQPPPPIFNNFNLPSTPRFNNVFSQLPKKGSIFHSQHPLKATLGRTKSKPESVIENIDTAIYKIRDSPKIEIRDPLLNVLADTFMHYINHLSPNETDLFYEDIRSNWKGVQSIVETENSVEPLRIFARFYYFN